MLRYSLLIFALILAVVPRVRPEEIPVTVGGIGILKFQPDFVTAKAGDVVVFTFKQANHTVTQSTLEAPCVKADTGFDTGFIPVAADVQDGFPIARLTIVDDTKPIWAFCRQGPHCSRGMVFAVNPGEKMDAFRAAATGAPAASSSVPASPPIDPAVSVSATSPPIGAATTVTATATVTVTTANPDVTAVNNAPAAPGQNSTSAPAPSSPRNSARTIRVQFGSILLTCVSVILGSLL